MKIAVIGCGKIANAVHLAPLSAMPDLEIKYVVDLIEERAGAAQKQYGAGQAVRDYRIVLNDREIDAVFVLTPNYSHYTITMDALRAGKHVFCEKPITNNYALSKEMADEARKRNLILNIGVCNRYHKSVELIKEYVEKGRLGELYHIYCSFRSFRSIPGLGGAFTSREKSGGGVLIDWGIHFLDLILYITGVRIQTVSANAYNKLGRDIPAYVYKDMWAGPPVLDGVCDVDDMVSGFIRTSGASISFNGAWAQNIDHDEMFIDFMGDKGGVRFIYGEGFTFYTAEDGILQSVKPDYKIPNMYEREDLRFIEAIRKGLKTRSHIDAVLESARLLDAIYESADKGAEVRISQGSAI
ncbi:MAG: Gfo/Idh/MocA family oxidoreductase [Spirochaetaceae bacterium]|jgi:predicted dehydrogenase|nr:Gfo/Idh/MocA family oxidoreductase [Spirochaetaceae bacterium]